MHPDLKIKISRMAKNSLGKQYASEYWNLVRKHGKSRRSMVDFICGIGGYSSWHDQFAISFNIKAYHADLSVENLWELLTSGKMDVGPAANLPPEHMAQAKALFWRVYEEHSAYLWTWSVEEAYEGWKDSDTPYETFVGERIDWEWEIHGRSGGHLSMTECGRSYSLKIDTEDLRETLMCKDGGEWDVPHSDIRQLFIICVQNSVDLTPRKISDEVEYRAAWRLWVSFCEDEIEQEVKEYDERAALSTSAGAIDRLLRVQLAGTTAGSGYIKDFEAICKLADIKIGG